MASPTGGGFAAFQAVAALITSVDPATLRRVAEKLSVLATDATNGGRRLVQSAVTVGEVTARPYQAYSARLRPVGAWVESVAAPAANLGGQVLAAATAGEQAHGALADAYTRLESRRTAINSDTSYTAPGSRERAMDAEYQREADNLQAPVDRMESAFGAIAEEPPAPAPVTAGSGGGGAGAGGAAGGGGAGGGAAGGPSGMAAGTGSGGAGVAGSGGEAGAAGVAPELGPESGAYEGWIRDPATGNLVDPMTGREVTPDGQFVDPVTGEPFGDAANASRLAGIDGLAPSVGGAGGGFVPAIGGAPAGGLEALRGGGAGGLAPVTGGGGGFVPAVGGGGYGGAGIAGLYGGFVPPSLAGQSPVGGQLRERAAENLAARARGMQNYASIAHAAAGTTHPAGFVPPMGGAGAGGMAGGAAAGPRGRGLVREPGTVWGAAGRGARRDGRTADRGVAVTEDPEVWTDTAPPARGAILG